MSRIHFAFALTATWLAAAGSSTAAGCDDLTPPQAVPKAEHRLITSIDLVRLRDMGPPIIEEQRAGLFALSPDGSKVAFQLRRADPETNAYCLGMFVLELNGTPSLSKVDGGGEPIMVSYSAWGFADSPPPGIPATVTPQWSSDGRWVLYLRRDRGLTQVWRASADGKGASQISHVAFDVERFGIDTSGRGLVLSGRPDLKRSQDELLEEGRVGYHYDERFMPAASRRPLVREPIDAAFVHINLDGGDERPASTAEVQVLSPNAADRPSGAEWTVRDGARLLWISPRSPEDVTAPTDLHVRQSDGLTRICQFAECEGIVDAWFGTNNGVFFLRHVRGQKASDLFRWTVGQGRPARILTTENLLSGCRIHGLVLLCGEEEPAQPRRLVEIDLANGQMRTLFEPNPEFANIHLGSVQKLTWTNAYGIETFGDLVLPPDHKPGERHPLVVIGYSSRGFLRGGTGDDFPIQVLAAKGFAVLSYQTPTDIGYFKGAKTWADMNRIARIDWLDFRSASSSVLSGVDAAIAVGAVDPERLGLTGLSYGSSTAQLTLVNSQRFKAAALSNCCEEASITNTLMGPAMVRILHSSGYPSLSEDGAAFWSPISFRANAERVTTPILFQLPDREFLGALEGFTALKEAGQPVDMYVFPDEGHIKFQPAHRLASYVRVVDWFDFWLNGKLDPSPQKANQYEIWRALKNRQ